MSEMISDLDAAMRMAHANQLAKPDNGWGELSGMWMVEKLEDGVKSLKQSLAAAEKREKELRVEIEAASEAKDTIKFLRRLNAALSVALEAERKALKTRHTGACPYWRWEQAKDCRCQQALSRANSPSTVLDEIRAKEKEQAYLEVESYATEQAKEAEWKYGIGSSVGMTTIGHYFGNKARKAALTAKPTGGK